MQRRISRLWPLGVLLLSSIGLLSCGGGGSSSAPAPSSPPVSVTYSNASLNGQYAFTFSGVTNGSVEAAAGTFTADGAGNLSAGIEDLNAPNGPYLQMNFTGTYSIGPDGRGSATISNSLGTITFKFVMTTSKHAVVVAFDNSDIGTGSVDLQDPTAFSTSALKGGYTFGLIGSDSSFNPIAIAGEFSADGAGHISNGLEDVNDNGTISNQSFSGSYSVDFTGRGTAAFSLGGTSTNYAFYVISSNQLDFVEIDSYPPLAGTVYQQQGSSFSNASLSGNHVFILSGLSLSQGSIVGGGLFLADGSGNISSGTEDENDYGSVSTDNPITGTYSIAADGRGTASLSVGGQPVNLTFYMISNGSAEFIETTPSNGMIVLGEISAQQGAPFSTATLKGHYAFLDSGFFIGGSSFASTGQVIADGNGGLGGQEDLNDGGSLMPSLGLTGNYSISSSGRGTASINNSQGTSTYIIYVVSPTEILFIGEDTSDVELGFATYQY